MVPVLTRTLKLKENVAASRSPGNNISRPLVEHRPATSAQATVQRESNSLIIRVGVGVGLRVRVRLK